MRITSKERLKKSEQEWLKDFSAWGGYKMIPLSEGWDDDGGMYAVNSNGMPVLIRRSNVLKFKLAELLP